ncbi:MAG: UDP-N-acetylmuramoyl-L-alanine--D-glutamate ligase [bacterium]|nr:UDP-N-acetylmuramoyl-L-alanine--D-glutamate ligase [bacterium]
MKITVVGAARSGVAAALLAEREGHNVFVTDSKQIDSMGAALMTLSSEGIRSEFGAHSPRAFDADLIVVSPGVPPSNAVRQGALERGIEVIGELEFAWRHCKNPIVAITGTNGKTTTTALTAHVLNSAGRKAVVAGNIGTPLSSVVADVDNDAIIVVEVSSYQLDTTVDFRPNVSVLLNVTPDHLSYHGTFEHYVHAKWKIFKNQMASDIVILNADDPHAAAASSVARATVRYISVRTDVVGAFVRGDEVFLRSDEQHKEELLMSVRNVGLRGVHNLYNSMAAALSARAFEVRNEDIRDSLQSFSGVEHRLENVRTHKGVTYINDSKATNVNAAWYALSSFDRPLIWIAGGRGDNNDYASLDELVDTNVKAIVCIGEDADAIFTHWCAKMRCSKATTMDEAVHQAADLAESGDIVLFSPACKSFDMFSNFEERGRVFKESVSSLG